MTLFIFNLYSLDNNDSLGIIPILFNNDLETIKKMFLERSLERWMSSLHTRYEVS